MLYLIIPILVGSLWLLFSLYEVRGLKQKSQSLAEESTKLTEDIERRNQELKEVEDRIKKSNEILEALASPAATARRKATTIEFKAKSSDKERIETALHGLGFTKIVSQISNISPDTIRFGSNVNLDDVKLVAYAFTSAGIQVKDLKAFANSSEGSYLIQVGASKVDKKQTALTVQDIRDIGPVRPGNAFPVIGSFTAKDEALDFVRKNRLRFAPYTLEVYLAENDYYAVTLGGYMDQSEASKRVRLAREKGIKDAYVWISDIWGQNLYH